MLTRDFCLTLLKESEGIITQHRGICAWIRACNSCKGPCCQVEKTGRSGWGFFEVQRASLGVFVCCQGGGHLWKRNFLCFLSSCPWPWATFCGWCLSTYHNKAWSSFSAGVCLPNTLSTDTDFRERLVKKVTVDYSYLQLNLMNVLFTIKMK